MVSTPAAAESVQTTFTVDANTTALYLFKEGTGTTTAHETVLTSPQPANGTLVGAVWAMGRQYYAVATDQGYVQIADSTALEPTSAITVEAWVKLQQSTGYVVCKNGNYFLTVGGTVAATFTVDGSNRNVNGVINVPTGQWVHLAMTWLKTSTTTGTGTIYVNGVLDTQTNFTGLTTGLIAAGYGSKMRIGQNDWSPIGSEMDGKIDSLPHLQHRPRLHAALSRRAPARRTRRAIWCPTATSRGD